MSMTVEKPGVLDSFQDEGRKGYARLGVNPSGPMDARAFSFAHALAGNPDRGAALECHFPAPVLRFDQPVVVGLAGADFGAMAADLPVPPNRTVAIPAGGRLHFTKKNHGERIYLAVNGGFALPQVLGSTSTNLKAGFGGYAGRRLQQGDRVPLRLPAGHALREVRIFPWFLLLPQPPPILTLRVLPGPEWEAFPELVQHGVMQEEFKIHHDSDRMGYRLEGPAVTPGKLEEMLSCPVTMGTVQCLPNGQLVVLMADHQTVGGYPRLLQVVRADLSLLAQLGPGARVCFQLVNLTEARLSIHEQEVWLQEMTSYISAQMAKILR